MSKTENLENLLDQSIQTIYLQMLSFKGLNVRTRIAIASACLLDLKNNTNTAKEKIKAVLVAILDKGLEV